MCIRDSSKPVPVDEFEKIIQLDVPMMKIE